MDYLIANYEFEFQRFGSVVMQFVLIHKSQFVCVYVQGKGNIFFSFVCLERAK